MSIFETLFLCLHNLIIDYQVLFWFQFTVQNLKNSITHKGNS